MIGKLKKLFLSLLVCSFAISGSGQKGAKTDTPGATVKTLFGTNVGNPIDEKLNLVYLLFIEAPGYKKQTVDANVENGNFSKLKKLPSLKRLVTTEDLGYSIRPGECRVNILAGAFTFSFHTDDASYRKKKKELPEVKNEYDLDFYSDRLQESLWQFLKLSSLADTSETFFRDDSKSLIFDMEFNDFEMRAIYKTGIGHCVVKGKIVVKDAYGTELGTYDFNIKCNPVNAGRLAWVSASESYAFSLVHGEYGMDIWSEVIEDVTFELTTSDLLQKIVTERKVTQEAILSQPILKLQKAKPLGMSAENLSSSIVTIKTKDGHGSGCLISSDGYIVTNHHVAGAGKDSIEVLLNNGEKYDAKLIRSDFVYDLALLKIESGFPFCAVEPSQSPMSKLGDKVTVIGTPADPSLGQTVTRGIVSGYRDAFGRKLIQTDAHINPGNSGGALFNDKGELIGIVSSKAAGGVVEGVGFAIPAHYIYERLRLEY
jgi:hypothetical protein